MQWRWFWPIRMEGAANSVEVLSRVLTRWHRCRAPGNISGPGIGIAVNRDDEWSGGCRSVFCFHAARTSSRHHRYQMTAWVPRQNFKRRNVTSGWLRREVSPLVYRCRRADNLAPGSTPDRSSSELGHGLRRREYAAKTRPNLGLLVLSSLDRGGS